VYRLLRTQRTSSYGTLLDQYKLLCYRPITRPTGHISLVVEQASSSLLLEESQA
jgi:hypothetical protein